MRSALLADLVDDLIADEGIDSVTVVRHGQLVLDAVVYPFTDDTGHNIHSCTKSVVGTLIGIAIDRGLLVGVDVPVVEILADVAPDTTDERMAAMTVEDLLTMSTGLDCRDSYLHDMRGIVDMQATDDWAANVLALPMAHDPGTRFEYCNGSSYLLSAVLSEVTGMPASEFADEALLSPLGITQYMWPASPEGITIGWNDLVLRPPDLAKLGELYLRDGMWGGDQLVARTWIETATTSHFDAGTLSDRYGYQWWIDDGGYVMALGFGGQYVVVVPEQDLVVAFTSGLAGDSFDRPEELVLAHVIPAIAADDRLPPDPEGHARLLDAVTTARSGPEPKTVELPDIAGTVDGVRYQYRPNDIGAVSFELRFGPDAAVLSFDTAIGQIQYDVGLDGRFLDNDASAITGPIAMRGAWRDEATFTIEAYTIGEVARGLLQFIFEDGVATVETHDVIAGTIATSVADRVG